MIDLFGTNFAIDGVPFAGGDSLNTSYYNGDNFSPGQPTGVIEVHVGTPVSVPEPASLGMIATATLCLIRRRHRVK